MFAKVKKWLFNYPEDSKWLLDRITDVVIDFLVEQVQAGAQVCLFRSLKSLLVFLDASSF